jgi:hypothetical protein
MHAAWYGLNLHYLNYSIFHLSECAGTSAFTCAYSEGIYFGRKDITDDFIKELLIFPFVQEMSVELSI